jgi:hypothetical protein
MRLYPRDSDYADGDRRSSMTEESRGCREFLQPTATYEVTLWTNVAVSGAYSVTAHSGAAHLGVHGVCTYLINLTTGETHSHARAFWTNHNRLVHENSRVGRGITDLLSERCRPHLARR